MMLMLNDRIEERLRDAGFSDDLDWLDSSQIHEDGFCHHPAVRQPMLLTDSSESKAVPTHPACLTILQSGVAFK